jgi:phosphopentomutase
MARAFLFVLDSFGIGNAPDAAAFGGAAFSDLGADTFGHIDAACNTGKADKTGLRKGKLKIPNMERLGLRHAHALAHGKPLPVKMSDGFFGSAAEISLGKDTRFLLIYWRKSIRYLA